MPFKILRNDIKADCCTFTTLYSLLSKWTMRRVVTVALLHNVVEDTDWTLEQLKAEGFSDSVITALSYMTHDDSVPYMEYVMKIAENPIAKKVKLFDLVHNSDLTRIDKITDKDLKRVQKYKTAIELRTNKIEVTKNV